MNPVSTVTAYEVLITNSSTQNCFRVQKKELFLLSGYNNGCKFDANSYFYFFKHSSQDEYFPNLTTSLARYLDFDIKC